MFLYMGRRFWASPFTWYGLLWLARAKQTANDQPLDEFWNSVPPGGGRLNLPDASHIAAKKVVKFRVAKAAKDAIVPPKVKKA